MQNKECNTRFILTCRDECIISEFESFIAKKHDSLCNFILLVGPAGSGKTACIGIMIEKFFNSCWQFATRNACLAAQEYINHTRRYYNTNYEFLAIDVEYMKTINDQMSSIDKFEINFFDNFKTLKDVIEHTKNYFLAKAKEMHKKCDSRRNYMTPNEIRPIIRRMKELNMSMTRENIVLQIEYVCLNLGRRLTCIPPEIRYDIFGFDEAGRTYMIFFLLSYNLFTYVNNLYGMPPCKPTYIFVGSHTQGNVISTVNDFWMKKYSLITMFTLHWLRNENIYIKSNMYNRRSPTRNEFTLKRNLLIKQAEDGLHIDVEDLRDLQKTHDRVFNNHFGPLDNGVLVFASTHQMATDMMLERYKADDYNAIKVDEYLALNAPSLMSCQHNPDKISNLHKNINSLLITEKYTNESWTRTKQALDYVTKQEENMFSNVNRNNSINSNTFYPEQAYRGDRTIILNIPQLTILSWRVCISKIEGPLEDVLNDLKLLNLNNMSDELIVTLIRAFEDNLSNYNDGKPVEHTEIDNLHITYQKYYNELRELSKQNSNYTFFYYMFDKYIYLQPNSIVEIIKVEKRVMWMKTLNTIYIKAYPLRYKRKNTLSDLLSFKEDKYKTKNHRKNNNIDNRNVIEEEDDYDDIIEDDIGYEEESLILENIYIGEEDDGGGGGEGGGVVVEDEMKVDAIDEMEDDDYENEDDIEIGEFQEEFEEEFEEEFKEEEEEEFEEEEERRLKKSGSKRPYSSIITTKEVKKIVKNKDSKSYVIWYIWPIASYYARTISVSQGSTISNKHIICFNNDSNIPMQDIIVGLTRGNDPKNQRISLPEDFKKCILPLDPIIINMNKIINFHKSKAGVL